MKATTTRPTWATVVALLLVPLLVAGGFLWGTWNATPRLRTVQAAVVNLDEMVEVNGQKMPLGRQLAAELVNSEREQNLTWVLADAKRAAEGLANGTFAAVVTIPEDFSKAATSFSGEPADAVQATIRVETSPVTGVSETALGQHIANAASTALNQFLTGEYLKNIYLGFNQMGDQFAELRDGTRTLADGSAQLADGAGKAADGSSLIGNGLTQLSAGSGQLRGGVQQLGDGMAPLAAGAGQAADGAGQLAGGMGQWASGAEQYAAGVSQWATGGRQYATGVEQFATGLTTYTDGVAQYAGAITSIVAPIRAFVEQLPDWGDLIERLDPLMSQLPAWAKDLDKRITAFVKDLNDFLDRVEGMVTRADSVENAVDAFGTQLKAADVACPADLADTPGACEAFERGVTATKSAAATRLAPVAKQADQLAADGATVGEWIDRIRTAADRLVTLSGQFVDWAPDVAAQWTAFKAQLPNGTLTKGDVLALLDQFLDAGNQLVSGGTQLSDGAAALAVGADQLADGAEQLAAGGGELVGGAKQLAGGASSLADGIGQLAGGLEQVADGMPQLVSGVGQYTGGVDQLAAGFGEFESGLTQLADGTRELADGTDALADGVAEGAGAIPSYTDSERENLAKVVASPINTEGLDDLVMPTVAWASLLIAMALWLGALAAYSVFKAVDSRNLTSSESTPRLLWRSVAPALGIVAAQAVALTALAAGVIGLSPTRALGLGAVSLVAAVAFVGVNHALAGWFGTLGRVASLALMLMTTVPAIAFSAPGFFSTLAGLSPLSPALGAIRMVMTGQPAAVPTLGLVAWALAAFGASYVAVARSRTVKLAAVTA